MKRLSHSQIRRLSSKASDAFWHVIAGAFPNVRSGDLSPQMTVRFDTTAEAAVTEWIESNCY